MGVFPRVREASPRRQLRLNGIVTEHTLLRFHAACTGLQILGFSLWCAVPYCSLHDVRVGMGVQSLSANCSLSGLLTMMQVFTFSLSSPDPPRCPPATHSTLPFQEELVENQVKLFEIHFEKLRGPISLIPMPLFYSLYSTFPSPRHTSILQTRYT